MDRQTNKKHINAQLKQNLIEFNPIPVDTISLYIIHVWRVCVNVRLLTLCKLGLDVFFVCSFAVRRHTAATPSFKPINYWSFRMFCRNYFSDLGEQEEKKEKYTIFVSYGCIQHREIDCTLIYMSYSLWWFEACEMVYFLYICCVCHVRIKNECISCVYTVYALDGEKALIAFIKYTIRLIEVIYTVHIYLFNL